MAHFASSKLYSHFAHSFPKACPSYPQRLPKDSKGRTQYMRLFRFRWSPWDKSLKILPVSMNSSAICSHLRCKRWISRRILSQSALLDRFPSFWWQTGWGIPWRELWHADAWFWYILEALLFITNNIQMDFDDLINAQLSGNLLPLLNLPTDLLFHRVNRSFSWPHGWRLTCSRRIRLRNHCRERLRCARLLQASCPRQVCWFSKLRWLRWLIGKWTWCKGNHWDFLRRWQLLWDEDYRNHDPGRYPQ